MIYKVNLFYTVEVEADNIDDAPEIAFQEVKLNPPAASEFAYEVVNDGGDE